MRLRHVIAVSTIGLAIAWVPFAAPASAATTTPVVNTTGLPNGFGEGGASCLDNGNGPRYGEAVHVLGPLTPPSGTGSLELTTTDQEQIDESFTNPVAASTLSELSTGYLNPAGNPATIEVDLNLNQGPAESSEDIVQLTLGSASSWTDGDLLTSQLTTLHVSSTTGITDQTTQTWSQFLSSHSGSQINNIDVVLAGCTGSQSDPKPQPVPVNMYVDNLRIGFNNATTAYDFEPSPTTAKLSLTVPATAKAGSKITIAGTVGNGSTPLTGERVTLLSKASGASTWTTAAVVNSDAKGAFSSKQKFTAATSYEWSYAGNQDVRGTTTAAKTVKLASKTVVSINAADRTLAKHTPVTLFGQITPAKAGVAITVYDRVGKRTHKLGHTKTKAHGAWGFSHSLAKGVHHLSAKAAAYSGHLAGTSKSITVHSKG